MVQREVAERRGDGCVAYRGHSGRGNLQVERVCDAVAARDRTGPVPRQPGVSRHAPRGRVPAVHTERASLLTSIFRNGRTVIFNLA